MFPAHAAALLTRLADEVALEQAWAALAPGAPPLPPRAAGILRALDLPSSTRGDLHAHLLPDSLEELSPPTLHHLALLHARRAAAALPGRAEGVSGSLRLTIACWLRLGAEREYLADALRATLGTSATQASLQASLSRAGWRGIEAASRVAANDVDHLGPAGAAAMSTLRHIDEALALAQLSEAEARAARVEAARALGRIVRSVSKPLEHTLATLEARDREPEEVRSFFVRTAAAWRFCGEEPELEHLVVRAVPTFAWPLYRAKRWAELRGALAPTDELVDTLAGRILRDPTQLPWASQCAQVIVFRAEVATTLEVQLKTAERALEVCPSLRNARLVLADLLCARAERLLDARGFLGGDLSSIAADVARAAELYPPLKRLPELRARLAKRGKVIP